MICFASALQLEGLSTKKPRTTKYSSKVVLVSVNMVAHNGQYKSFFFFRIDQKKNFSFVCFYAWFFQSSETPPSTSIYRLNGTNKATCILIQTDGILDITYRSVTNEDITKPIFLPDYPELAGDCSDDISSISLDFRGFKLLFEFRKTPGGERWYISNVELFYSTSNPLLEHVDRPGLQVTL